jgi:hypothetical protein
LVLVLVAGVVLPQVLLLVLLLQVVVPNQGILLLGILLWVALLHVYFCLALLVPLHIGCFDLI